MTKPVITIRRMRYTDAGTFGTMTVERDGKRITLATGELPWRNNRNRISCIPQGEYAATFTHSPSRKRMLWRLHDVPNRSGILIHNGNWCGDVSLGMRTDVLGCILVGERHGEAKDQPAVLNSRAALDRLHKFLDGASEARVLILGDSSRERTT